MAVRQTAVAPRADLCRELELAHHHVAALVGGGNAECRVEAAAALRSAALLLPGCLRAAARSSVQRTDDDARRWQDGSASAAPRPQAPGTRPLPWRSNVTVVLGVNGRHPQLWAGLRYGAAIKLIAIQK